MGINVLSLYDGMSCGQIALSELGIKINKYYASEIEKKCYQGDTGKLSKHHTIRRCNIP